MPLWYLIIFHFSEVQFHNFGNQKSVELLASWKPIIFRWQTSLGLQVWMGSLVVNFYLLPFVVSLYSNPTVTIKH